MLEYLPSTNETNSYIPAQFQDIRLYDDLLGPPEPVRFLLTLSQTIHEANSPSGKMMPVYTKRGIGGVAPKVVGTNSKIAQHKTPTPPRKKIKEILLVGMALRTLPIKLWQEVLFHMPNQYKPNANENEHFIS